MKNPTTQIRMQRLAKIELITFNKGLHLKYADEPSIEVQSLCDIKEKFPNHRRVVRDLESFQNRRFFLRSNVESLGFRIFWSLK